MLNPNAALHEQCKIVTGLAPIAPSSSTPDYVSLKGFQRCAVVITQDNGTAPTGSAVTLLQAQNVAGTGEKALAFSSVGLNADSAAGDALTATTVTNNTFTTSNTADKNSIYVIDVKASDLDINNGFDCVRAGTADATNSVVSVVYVLYPRKYGLAGTSAIAD